MYKSRSRKINFYMAIVSLVLALFFAGLAIYDTKINQTRLGFFSGLFTALALAFFIGMRKNSGRRNELDERQKVLMGAVYADTLIFAGLLLFFNTIFMETSNINWISTTNQNIVILAISSIFFLGDRMLRGAYFGTQVNPKQVRLFQILAIIYWIIPILSLYRLIQSKESLIILGKINGEFFQILAYLWSAIVFSIVVLGWYLEKKKMQNESAFILYYIEYCV